MMYDCTEFVLDMYILSFIIKGVKAMGFSPLSTIFQLYRGGQFFWKRKPEYPEKSTDILPL
jgi:hypothetical protein